MAGRLLLQEGVSPDKVAVIPPLSWDCARRSTSAAGTPHPTAGRALLSLESPRNLPVAPVPAAPRQAVPQRPALLQAPLSLLLEGELAVHRPRHPVAAAVLGELRWLRATAWRCHGLRARGPPTRRGRDGERQARSSPQPAPGRTDRVTPVIAVLESQPGPAVLGAGNKPALGHLREAAEDFNVSHTRYPGIPAVQGVSFTLGTWGTVRALSAS